jgi:hypothetical protein
LRALRSLSSLLGSYSLPPFSLPPSSLQGLFDLILFASQESVRREWLVDIACLRGYLRPPYRSNHPAQMEPNDTSAAPLPPDADIESRRSSATATAQPRPTLPALNIEE